MKNTIIIMLAMVLSFTADAQTTVSGIVFPATYKVGDNNLVLNGTGSRHKFFIEVYVCGLYLTAKKKDGAAIVKADEAMDMRIVITSGLVSSEKMIEATKEGFTKSTGGKTAPLQAKIDKFLKVFNKEPIVKNDVFDIAYAPAEGVKIFKNNKLVDTIPGLDFKTALFGIWLGADPAEEKMKIGLLGN